MTGTILSLLMLAGIALTVGGAYLLVKKRDRQRALLMIAAGVVMFVNVAIWAVPLG
jgi:LPXTG-motif cell wall-anchored protein